MGMQCHFKVTDLPNFSKVVHFDYEEQFYSYQVHPNWVVDCSIEGNAWFDIGSCSISAMSNIEWLIKNRVCFTCS
jgi:hypothetical protein